VIDPAFSAISHCTADKLPVALLQSRVLIRRQNKDKNKPGGENITFNMFLVTVPWDHAEVRDTRVWSRGR